jgi:FO synthase subunit 1
LTVGSRLPPVFPGCEEHGISISVDDAAVERLLDVEPADVDSADALTFARNVFLPLTTACRYTCTYCTFYDVPGEASLMSPGEVRETCRRGADAGCTEALFTLGDEPDDRYTDIHGQIDDLGYDSIHDYLRACCEAALDEGLLPHANPGDMTPGTVERLAPAVASMGTMLETTADVAAHAGGRRKTPGQRLATIRAAGEANVPFTTGVLVGIGESVRDRAESLLAIREMHERYGHVQEVIVQNVVPNERSDFARPSVATMRRTVAMARAALPASVSVQVPPNLSPTRDLLDCGVDDLGGVSPVTVDHVNPDYAWPGLDELVDLAEDAGVPLYERLPVYDRYLPETYRRPGVEPAPGTWLRGPVRQALAADDAHGGRYRRVARRERPVEHDPEAGADVEAE